MEDVDRKLDSKTLRMNELTREKSYQEPRRRERVRKEDFVKTRKENRELDKQREQHAELSRELIDDAMAPLGLAYKISYVKHGCNMSAEGASFTFDLPTSDFYGTEVDRIDVISATSLLVHMTRYSLMDLAVGGGPSTAEASFLLDFSNSLNYVVTPVSTNAELDRLTRQAEIYEQETSRRAERKR